MWRRVPDPEAPTGVSHGEAMRKAVEAAAWGIGDPNLAREVCSREQLARLDAGRDPVGDSWLRMRISLIEHSEGPSPNPDQDADWFHLLLHAPDPDPRVVDAVVLGVSRLPPALRPLARRRLAEIAQADPHLLVRASFGLSQAS